MTSHSESAVNLFKAWISRTGKFQLPELHKQGLTFTTSRQDFVTFNQVLNVDNDERLVPFDGVLVFNLYYI